VVPSAKKPRACILLLITPDLLKWKKNQADDHDPIAQVRCCGDAKPISGDDKSVRDQYWGGRNLMVVDNKLSFPEMVLYTMGGSKQLNFHGTKIFLKDAKLIMKNPVWEPYYKGYKMFRNFHPIGGHMKEMKKTTPKKCEQECTNSPGVGLCEGFVVLRDMCWLKTSAFTDVRTGDKAVGTYYFQKQHEEHNAGYSREAGPNMVPESISFLKRNEVVSVKRCAQMCSRPPRGVCIGYMIDKRGLCHLASKVKKGIVQRQGYNFFFKIKRKGPSLPGFKKNYRKTMSNDLQKYGRRTPEQCAKLCKHAQWGLCAAFELRSNGECILKSSGGRIRSKNGSTLYTIKSMSSTTTKLARGRYSVSSSQLSGSVRDKIFSGKVSAKLCRKSCDHVPMFIGSQRVRGSRQTYCAGFHVLASGTCELFSRITRAHRSSTTWSFRNRVRGVSKKMVL
jgi:hypothetical protein